MRHKNDCSADALSDGSVAVPEPRFAENGYRLPDPLPTGLVLTDSTQRQWLLGKSIGCGGFGEIYCAQELPESERFSNHSPNSTTERTGSPIAGTNSNRRPISESKCADNYSYNGLPKRRCVQTWNRKQLFEKNKEKLNKLIKESNYPFVVKVDHISGPLFAEMHFYHRVAKPKLIDNWMLTQRLAFIGMPRYVASGIYTATKTCRKYRFLVLDRLGLDLQKILDKQNNRLSLKSAYTIAMMTLDILAYIHSFGYIHADIKASNLLLGRLETTSPAREIYLVDYGLVERYRTQDGEHKEEEEDNRRANSGTIEFTSRDGHVGALTRRSDLEILAYNTISWLSGARLPWIDCKEHEKVRKQKEYYMCHIDELLRYAFTSKSLIPKGLEEFVRSVSRLGFKEDPNYATLKLILTRALVGSGYTNDGLITWGEKTLKTTNKKGIKRPVSSSPAFERSKARKLERQEFEQFEFCEIPRKLDRNRTVRSAPTTTSRQRSGSISPNVLNIELSNPTPQMLEVIEKIRHKSETIERESESFESHLCANSTVHKKRIRTYSSGKRGAKARKLKQISIKNCNKCANNKKLKTNTKYEPMKELNNTYGNNELKSVSNGIQTTKTKKQRKSKKFKRVIARKCSTNRERIPLQKLEINVKTTNTTTKRCSNRTVDSNGTKKGLKTVFKAKQQKEKKIVKTLVTRSKAKSVAKVKKLAKKSSTHSSANMNSSLNRIKTPVVVDLPNGSLKCDKHLRTTTNGNKRIK